MRLRVLLLTVCLAACDREPAPSGRQAPRGLPPAEGGAAVPAAPGAEEPRAANPHGANPQAANPHEGLGIPPPSGAPASDPSRVLEGTIDVAPALKGQVKAGDVIFISAKRVDPATGDVGRTSVAVARVQVTELPAAFRLDRAHVMGSGDEFSGKVMLIARVDRDQEASTRAAGDIEGKLPATIPQSGLRIVLDTTVGQ